MKELSDQEKLAWHVQILLNSRESPDTRKDAAKWLSNNPTSEAFNALWQCREDNNIKVRRAIIKALGAFENPDVFLLLKHCLQDNDEFVRRNALETLSGWSNETDLASRELISQITSLLDDQSIEVRKASLFFACEHKNSHFEDTVKSRFFKLLNDEKANEKEYNLARITYAKYVGEETVSGIINERTENKLAEAHALAVEERRRAVEDWKKRVAEFDRRIQNSLEKLKKPVPLESHGYRLIPANHYEEALLELGSLYFDCYILPWLMKDIIKLNEAEWIEGSKKQITIPAGLGSLDVKIGYNTNFEYWTNHSIVVYFRVAFKNPEGYKIIKHICDVMLSDSPWRTRWFAAAILRCLKDVSALPALSKATKDEEGDVRDEARDAINEISTLNTYNLGGQFGRRKVRNSPKRRRADSKEKKRWQFWK